MKAGTAFRVLADDDEEAILIANEFDPDSPYFVSRDSLLAIFNYLDEDRETPSEG